MQNSTPAAISTAVKLAVDKGDAAAFLRELYESCALDGITYLLRSKYLGALDASQIDDCLADGVEVLFSELTAGELIRHPVAYLKKIAHNKAADLVRSEEFASRSNVNLDSVAGRTWPDEEPEVSIREVAKLRALERARAYVPQLGQNNIQLVMTVLLDAVEKQVTDLPHSKIAELTGLSVDTARKLLHRGIERLTAKAKQDGLHIEKYLIDEYSDIFHSADNDQNSQADD